MSAKWSDFIQEGKFKDVKFDFLSAREPHHNILDVRRFPNRNGAFIESRARNEIRIEIMAVFVEENYPENYFDVVNKLTDGTPGELVHPIHGTIQAACESFTPSHDAEEPDSATIQIVFVEHTKNTQLVFENQPTVAGKASETRADASDASVNAEVYRNSVLNAIEATSSTAVALASAAYATAYNIALLCTTAANTAASIADSLEAEGDTFSALEIQSQSNQALSALDVAVKSLADYSTQEAYDTSRSLLSCSASLGSLATLLINQKPPLSVFVVAADISLLAWVHAQYGDSSRVDEVLALNSIPDPLLIPAGTSLRAYAV